MTAEGSVPPHPAPYAGTFTDSVAPMRTATSLAVVLDTNVVLDLLLFGDPSTGPLRDRLRAGALRWIATPRMADELARVLGYPALRAHVAMRGTTPDAICARMAAQSARVPAAPACGVPCRDADDQCFIDLAVAHTALLLSKDMQVLRLRRRLAPLGVVVARSLPAG